MNFLATFKAVLATCSLQAIGWTSLLYLIFLKLHSTLCLTFLQCKVVIIAVPTLRDVDRMSGDYICVSVCVCVYICIITISLYSFTITIHYHYIHCCKARWKKC